MNTQVISKDDVVEAVRTAIRECNDHYAQSYLRELPLSSDMYGEYVEYWVVLQLLYALHNMGTWRGENAKAAKSTLRAFCKANGR